MEELKAKYQNLLLMQAELLMKELAMDVPSLIKQYVEKTETKLDDVVYAAIEPAVKQILLDMADKIHKG